jgi:DNA-binding MarR family transcriptional regulator
MMEAKKENSNIFKPSEELRDLRLLEELERNPIISQRELSHKFGIALGVTNACLKRMARKGWVRIRGFDHRRIGYYLTPKGLVEKSRLTFHLVSGIVQHYSELKKVIGQRLLEMEQRGMKRVVFYGVSDEMEVAYITLQGVNLKLVGIVEDDEKFQSQFIFGYEIEPVSRVKELKSECILITSLEESEKKKEKLQTLVDTKSVYISDICLKQE